MSIKVEIVTKEMTGFSSPAGCVGQNRGLEYNKMTGGDKILAGPVRTRRPSGKKSWWEGTFSSGFVYPHRTPKMKRLTACLKECCMMKRTLSALMLSGALLCALSVPALAAEPAAPQTGTSLTPGGDPSGQRAVLRHCGRRWSGMRMGRSPVRPCPPERYGDYVMNLSADAVWVDAGEADRLRSLRPGGW